MDFSKVPELKDFKREQIERIIFETQAFNPLAWVYVNKARNERGSVLSFKNHKFLIQPFCDLSPKQVYLKAAQVGVSIMNVFKTLWLARFRDMNLIYTLPTVEDVRVFVPSKVNPIIQNNHQMATWVKDKDNVETKRVGRSFIYYRGTFTSREALMLSSDLNVYDEIDRSDLEVVNIYSSRLKFSEFKGEWFLSNPSAPAVGVGAKFAISTQNHWFLKPSCGHWQYLEWEKNVDRKLREYVCEQPSCRKVITDDDRRNGRWVEKFKDKEFKGYWISQMMAPWISAKELIAEEEDKSKAYFNNFVLGIPYVGSDVVIDETLILKNITTAENSKIDCIMWVDQGLKKHWVIGNKEGIFAVGSTHDWKDIENLRNKHDAIMVIDALPDLTVPRQLREKYQHKVHLCYYHRDKDKAVDTKWGQDKDWGYVWADRNRTLQTVIDYLAAGKLKFNMKDFELAEYIKHWKTMYKLIEEDNLGVPKFTWASANNLDHFVHAQNYFLIGLKRYSEQRGSVVKNPESRPIRGETSFYVENDTMPNTAVYAKEPKDWRYS